MEREVFFYSIRDLPTRYKRGMDSNEVPITSMKSKVFTKMGLTATGQSYEKAGGYYGRVDHGYCYKGAPPAVEQSTKIDVQLRKYFTQLSEETFLSDVPNTITDKDTRRYFKGSLEEKKTKTITLFVHGYNVAPKHCFESAAKIDLQFTKLGKDHDRLTFAFVWPSNEINLLNHSLKLLPYGAWSGLNKATVPLTGKTMLPIPFVATPGPIRAHYGMAGSRVDYAAFHLAKVLASLTGAASENQTERFDVDVIAHSMGTEVLTKAFLFLAAAKEDQQIRKALGISSSVVTQEPQLRNIVLMGADLPIDKLINTLPIIGSKMRGQMLILLNKRDIIVKASSDFQNGIQRVASANWDEVAHRLTDDLSEYPNLLKRLSIVEITKTVPWWKFFANHNPTGYTYTFELIVDFLKSSQVKHAAHQLYCKPVGKTFYPILKGVYEVAVDPSQNE